ncbi:Uncharacterised protein [Corynebacterium striatum]|uniref:alkaline shock response membrane anchor protein AmaP n=1 Tax=Corynebacterium striatum TaxID=43770 RepID=UPI000DFB3185|nr:alkaline shock response membrane anchor protein AmaP [Corynebacterium striatum]STD34397.1 Uncharacterised protein [Corynebacterium striatum]
MSKGLAAFDRILLLIIAAILIVLGLWPILIHFEVPFALYFARWVDHDEWAALPQQGWWAAALGTATVVLAVSGLWLVIANLRHHRFNNVASESSNDNGKISTNMQAIAGAVADTLAAEDGVDKVTRLVAYDRARPTLQYTVEANPDTALSALVDAVETNEQDFRLAFPEADLDTVYKLHFGKVRALKE